MSTRPELDIDAVLFFAMQKRERGEALTDEERDALARREAVFLRRELASAARRLQRSRDRDFRARGRNFAHIADGVTLYGPNAEILHQGVLNLMRAIGDELPDASWQAVFIVAEPSLREFLGELLVDAQTYWTRYEEARAAHAEGQKQRARRVVKKQAKHRANRARGQAILDEMKNRGAR